MRDSIAIALETSSAIMRDGHEITPVWVWVHPSYGMPIAGESLRQFTMPALVTSLTSPPYVYHACHVSFHISLFLLRIPFSDLKWTPPICKPIISDGLLRQDSLFDVHSPTREILRPSVFIASDWVRGRLAAKEYLDAYNILASERSPLGAIGISLSSLLVTTLFHAIWSEKFGGGSRESDSKQIPLGQTRIDSGDQPLRLAAPSGVGDKKEDREEGGVEDREEGGEEDKDQQQITPHQAPIKCKDTRILVDDSAVCKAGSLPSAAQAKSTTASGSDPDYVAKQARLEKVKWEHGLARTVKSDDAEVPVHFWDKDICRGEASELMAKALSKFRAFFMCIYRRRLLKDAIQFLCALYGGWHSGSDELGWRRRARREAFVESIDFGFILAI